MSKLLLIDDERPILEMLEMSLASEGHEVVTAESGEEGLQIFQQENLDLILTDLKMPGLDGIEVLERIKSINGEAEVIVITGHGDMESAIAALRAGASDFVTKPIRDEILMLALDRAEKRIKVNKQLQDYRENLEQKVGEYALELEQAQEELIRNERLATIGETVAGLAHYIKNILTGLRGGMHLVDMGMTKDNRHRLEEGWGMVQRNVERVSDLALDLLRYSKDREPERSVCKPNEIVSEAMELFEEKAREHHVKLTKALDPNVKDAYLDRDGIYNVLSNLVSNAIDACLDDTDTSKAWEVIVKTELEKAAGSDDTVVFEVSDNGCGMTDEVQEKLFTKFFSTKGGRGTGLGLLGSQKIVHEHGGEISAESKAGEGTTFCVRLEQKISEAP